MVSTRKTGNVAEAVAAGLQGLQHPDGWWPVSNVYQHQQANTLEPNIAVTAELMAHLCPLATAIAIPVMNEPRPGH